MLSRPSDSNINNLLALTKLSAVEENTHNAPYYFEILLCIGSHQNCALGQTYMASALLPIPKLMTIITIII